MTREEAIKFAVHAQSLADIPEVKEFYAFAESALREQEERRWIPVTERLPYQTDPAQKVLFVTKKGCIYTGTYFKGTTTNQFDGWYSMCTRIGGVTHWMPLPEPPKEDKP